MPDTPGTNVAESDAGKSAWHKVAERIGVVLKRLRKLNLQFYKMHESLWQLGGGGTGVDKGTQMLLTFKYQEQARAGVILPFQDVEFRNFSQNGEDGILHYIFSLIGTTNKRALEICAGNGRECNAANLILNHGWHAVLVDGHEERVKKGLRFFANHPDTLVMGPRFLHRWVTPENINTMLAEADFGGEIDLFSLDLDGLDYWIWEALTAVNPRVVVLEFMPQLGSAAVTVPNSESFETQWLPLFDQDAQGDELPDGNLPEDLSFFGRWTMYGGASLAAFNKLAKRKGYRLVGANSIGFNAFFLRDDVAPDIFPEVSVESCFNENARARFARAADKVKDMDWQEV